MAETKFEDLDLYNLLGITITATTSEVKKAYRKKALSCHPDKNPDNPKAAELFHELSKALEILTDESARAAYDKVLKSKAAAKLRHQQLDSRRKKFKEELEARERAAQETPGRYSSASKTDEEKLQAEIERLRKEGSRLVEEEINYVQSIIEEEKRNKLKGFDLHNSNDKRLRIKWDAKKDDNTNGGYNYNLLHNMLSKYGTVTVLLISPKKKGSAIVEFETVHSALTAQQMETGLESNPCVITWLGRGNSRSYSKQEPKLSDVYSGKENPSTNEVKPNEATSSRSSSSVIGKSSSTITDNDFETLVLQRMRRAQERKDLENGLKQSDKDEDQN